MAKSKTYVLGMFPYPSGEGLHVGHVRIFTACDVMARYFRMKSQSSDHSLTQGSELKTVLSPMGWDAFGLPAENAAIKAKKIPQEMVPKNYANFKKQMQNLSLSFDWEREFATTDPEYYAITQWIFLQLYKKGLVYREKVAINWCPKCLTGLANEEVYADGTHERCHTPVTKKLLPQWVMKITDYAERLLSDLDIDLKFEGKKLDSERKGLDWPRGILEMQRNWIGKKEGVVVTHQVKDMDLQIETFSAYPAWLYADTFIAIAPEHPLVKTLVEGTDQEKAVMAFVEEAAKITTEQRTADKFEKKGIFTGRYAMDPLHNGRRMPIWVANFAIMGFGTGIIRCSGHDPRDWEFAQKYGISVNEVVDRVVPEHPVSAHDNEGVLKNSGPFDGKSITPKVTEEMVAWFVEQGHTRREVTWHLRDWVFSRQRYWGEPIPLVYCASCAKTGEITNNQASNSKHVEGFDVVEKDGEMMAIVPVPESQLPLELPTLESYEPTDTGESPLSRVSEWVNTTCPNCGGPAKRETDTMPNWAGSCWYFLGFAFWGQVELPSRSHLVGRKSKDLQGETFGSQRDKPYTDWWMNTALPEIKKWLPVDWYLGGAEHAVLHLLYARFWVKVLQDLGLVDFPEPFLRLRSVGLVLAEDGKKMSKSLGNVVNPDDMVAKYGSDAVRMYEMFMGPWEQSIAWDSGAISGQVRFLGRIKETAKQKGKVGKVTTPVMAAKLKALVERVEQGVLAQKFNTAIAGLMEFVNSWRAEGEVLSRDHMMMFASLLSLFAPETAESISHTRYVIWPDVSGISGVDEVSVTIAVQVNGKLRGVVEMSKEESENREKVIERAMQNEQIKKWVTGEVKKVIFVPGRLINLLV